MIALVVAVLCARIVVAGLGFVFGLVLAVAGIAIELSYATLRWVMYPIAAGVWWATRRVFADRPAVWVVPPVLSPLQHPPTCHASARQRAVLAGVRAARV